MLRAEAASPRRQSPIKPRGIKRHAFLRRKGLGDFILTPIRFTNKRRQIYRLIINHPAHHTLNNSSNPAKQGRKRCGSVGAICCKGIDVRSRGRVGIPFRACSIRKPALKCDHIYANFSPYYMFDEIIFILHGFSLSCSSAYKGTMTWNLTTFQDMDGYLWEIAWNPFFRLTKWQESSHESLSIIEKLDNISYNSNNLLFEFYREEIHYMKNIGIRSAQSNKNIYTVGVLNHCH